MVIESKFCEVFLLNSFIARQPILDENTATYGYELLFRDGIEKLFSAKADEDATLSVIDSATLTSGFNLLSSKKRVFINFTEKLLLEGYWTILPKEKVIIEILENVNPTKEVIETCKFIKQNGYMIALDDFHYSAEWDPIIDIVDIIKIDIKASSKNEVEAYAIKYGKQKVKLLAEKVETLQEYYWTKKLGYTYFQGYFFSKPEIIKSEQIPASRLTKLRLIHEINKPDFEYSEAEELLKHDPGLTIKLLKYVNSAAMGVRNEISGIRQALALIGQVNIRKWISILAVANFTEKKPKELMRQVVKRGQFCELLAPHFGYLKREAQSLYLIGMFSLLDGVLDLPMSQVFEEVPLSDEITDTILGKNTPYKDILQLAITFETGNWGKLNFLVKKHKLMERELVEAHVSAIEWAENFIE